MKRNSLITSKLFPVIAAAVFLAGTVSISFAADHRGGNNRGHNRTEQRIEHGHNQHIEQGRNQHVPGVPHHYSYRSGRYYRAGIHGSVVIPAPFGQIVMSLPGVYRRINDGPRSYFFCNGIFYSRHPHGYEVVRGPRLRFIPYEARRVVIGGGVYFVHNDLYYCYRDGFYEVCEPPLTVGEPRPETTTFMVTNSNGSRTPVELEAVGANQWKGPRGEIYEGLPTDDQLRQGYGF